MNYYDKITRILTMLVIACFPIFAAAQGKRIIPFIKESIRFDGMPDEPVWSIVPDFQFAKFDLENGAPPVQKTNVRIFYDDKYLYIGSSFNYIDLKTISHIGKIRDFTSWNSDWLGVFIDTYNDKSNMLMFLVNPNGIRLDGSVKNDMINGDNDLSFNQNMFWDAKSEIRGNNWFSELRVPLSTLRFQGKSDSVAMGISMMRWVANSGNPDYKTSTFPALPLSMGQMAYLRASLAQEVCFPGLKSRLPVYFTPYLSAGINSSFDESASRSRNEKKMEAGADLKIGLSNNLTLDVTLNTDFAQVEADQEQFNLTRFSLSFPENRPFFQEKSDVFDFVFGSTDKLFYSRRIGLYDHKPVRIYGGARLTGRIGLWDLGMMSIQTAGFGEIPMSNYGVLRTKRTVINQKSFAGGIFTSRIGKDGNWDFSYGLDSKINLFGEDYLNVSLATTNADKDGARRFSKDQSRAYIKWERPKKVGFSYEIGANWSGEDFDPATGLETRESIFYKAGTLRYHWIPGGKSALNNQTLFIHAGSYNSTSDGSFESAIAEAGWSYEGKKITTGRFSLVYYDEYIKSSFIIREPDILVPAGEYGFLSGLAIFSILVPDRSLTLEMTAEAGGYYDGQRLTASVQPVLNIGSSLIMNLTYQIDRINFNSRSIKYTNNIFGLRTILMFTPKLNLSGYVQLNTFNDRIIANARLRYNFREGNDFYLVYNEGINSSRRPDLHLNSLNENRTLSIKYIYTFTGR